MNARLLNALSLAFALLSAAGLVLGLLLVRRHGGDGVVLVAVVPLAAVSLLCALFARRAKRRG
jgi:hypothetical protein